MNPIEQYRETEKTLDQLNGEIEELEQRFNAEVKQAEKTAARISTTEQAIRDALSDTALKQARQEHDDAAKVHADAFQLKANLEQALQDKRADRVETEQDMEAACAALWEQEYADRLETLKTYMDEVVEAAAVGVVTGRVDSITAVEQAFISELRTFQDFQPVWEAVAERRGLPIPKKFR